MLGQSKMYESAAARDNGIESVKKNGPEGVIADLSA
ncbi:MAG: YegP family protein [Methylotenera sp.]|nr:YegP family protein [Methylotenera sp.]